MILDTCPVFNGIKKSGKEKIISVTSAGSSEAPVLTGTSGRENPKYNYANHLI